MYLLYLYSALRFQRIKIKQELWLFFSANKDVCQKVSLQTFGPVKISHQALPTQSQISPRLVCVSLFWVTMMIEMFRERLRKVLHIFCFHINQFERHVVWT